MKEAGLAVPHQRPLLRLDAVAELEQRNGAVVGLPHEQVEIIVVEPAPAGSGLGGNALDLAQHGVSSRLHFAYDRRKLREVRAFAYRGIGNREWGMGMVFANSQFSIPDSDPRS